VGLQCGGLGRLGVSWACFAAHTKYDITIFPIFFGRKLVLEHLAGQKGKDRAHRPI